MSNTPQLAPVGTVVAYAGENPAALEDYGWLVCDGRPLPRAYYQELFQQISTNYGAPSGDTFNIPMLQGLFLRGGSGGNTDFDPDVSLRKPLMPGGSSGANIGSLQTYGTAPAVQAMKSDIPNSAVGKNNVDVGCQTRGAKYQGSTTTAAATMGGDRESRPINKYVYYLVKYRTFDKYQEYVKFPVGSIIPFAGSVATGLGSNWILCDGSAKDTTGTYAKLFAAIAFAHGKASDTRFVLPDYRGYFLRGVNGATGKDPESSARTAPYTAGGEGGKGNSGNAVGSEQGYATGLPVKANFLTTFHNLPTGDSSKEINGVIRDIFKYNSGSVWVNVSQGGGDSETRPRNVYVDWYIRYQ